MGKEDNALYSGALYVGTDTAFVDPSMCTTLSDEETTQLFTHGLECRDLQRP